MHQRRIQNMLKLLQIEIRKTFRNKRFLIFTILVPLFFMISLKMTTGYLNHLSVQYLYLICAMYGMIGNNLVTMSTKIAKEKDFYLSIFKTSKLKIVNHTCVQFFTQSILNGLIMLILFLVAYFFLGLTLNTAFFFDIVLVYLFCNVFVFVGAIMGYLLDPVSLQVISNPVYMGLVMLSMPTALVNMFPKLIQNVYALFPGHFLWLVITQINDEANVGLGMVKFLLYLFSIALISSIVLVIRQKKAIARG